LALLDTPGTTLLGINRMLSDKEYRTMIIKNVTDPIVKQFWIQEFAAYDAKFATEAVAPIQNKIGQFLSSSIMRNIVAQAQSSINIRKAMDEQKILIINLSKGRVGEDAMRLLGGMLITKIQMSAMERVNVPEEERIDFYMYVDEFQNFAVDSFASILSEARKYRLNLVMAHQYIAQLEHNNNTAVRDAVFGNVGTIISFRVGSPDAEFMENEFMPRFTPEDLINLPKTGIYLKLMIDGVTSQPFSATTLPPISQRTGSAERVVAQSRERYAGNRGKIEEHVAEWSGFGGEVDVDKMLADVGQAKKEAKKARFAHQYNCTRCGKSFELPVELDRSRPIYCEECHQLNIEERKNGKGPRRPAGKVYALPTPPPVKVGDGDLVEHPVAETAISLSTLEVQKPLASTPPPVPMSAPVPPRITPTAPRPPMPSRPAPPAIPGTAAVSAPGERAPGEESAEKKKRRRRRKKPSDGQRTSQMSSTPVPQPAPQLPSAISHPGAVPTPVIPGERITFDE
jgi:hypothetical protein